MDKIGDDVRNFDINNKNEEEVLKSNYFSAYKGKMVVRIPNSGNAFSFGAIFMGSGNEIKDVKHEYGHTIQFDKMGPVDYVKYVAIPSVTYYNLTKNGKVPHELYYNMPWEYQAELYGNVTERDHEPWANKVNKIYSDLVNVLP
ncbi:hypothetical protein RBG61_00400 [Paludicola sp. MB14-C6]|uniref:hypothetical protein n=1 Tax=Paludihabitans sp. MB14-C6 TaxID=3070656 RepID=UPI0027DBBAA3|nr:hypothetical protein [Paludicola sp. MB14-C6]WMJ23151.1 hypothetical protein RBG61_00400 [Paludicola sp. MB14-C6]